MTLSSGALDLALLQQGQHDVRTSPGQPFRLNLMAALADSVPDMLHEEVHTWVFDEIKPNGLWPPAKLMLLGPKPIRP